MCGEVCEEGLDGLGQRLELFRGESARSDAVLRRIVYKRSSLEKGVAIILPATRAGLAELVDAEPPRCPAIDHSDALPAGRVVHGLTVPEKANSHKRSARLSVGQIDLP